MPIEHAQKSHDFLQNGSERFRQIWFRKIQTNLVQKYSDYYKFRNVQTIYQIQKDSETEEKFSHISESQFFWMLVWDVQPVSSHASERVQKKDIVFRCIQTPI